MSEQKMIDWEKGWDFIEQRITKLKNSVEEGRTEPFFTSEDYMMLYTTVYSMCTQKPSNGYPQQLYDKYKEFFQEYITSTVLPSLRETNDDELMLRDIVKRWSDHKIMVQWMSRIFDYLGKHYVRRRSIPGLKEVAIACFRDLVYEEFNGKIRDVSISLINHEREGRQIDRALLKNVVDIFMEIGMGKMELYVRDFEAPMVEDTAAYYSQKASKLISEESSLDNYMLQVEECLKLEKERVSHYLHPGTETKLLERVRQELLTAHAIPCS